MESDIMTSDVTLDDLYSAHPMYQMYQVSYLAPSAGFVKPSRGGSQLEDLSALWGTKEEIPGPERFRRTGSRSRQYRATHVHL